MDRASGSVKIYRRQAKRFVNKRSDGNNEAADGVGEDGEGEAQKLGRGQ